MEVIRKKICLNDGRNRVKGSLPYFPYDEPCDKPLVPNEEKSNFGGFTVDFNGGSVGNMTGYIRTAEMMRRYNAILEILRNGKYFRRRKGFVCKVGESDNVFLPLKSLPDFDSDEFKTDVSKLNKCLNLKNNAIAMRLFKPYDSDDFTVDRNGFYRYNGKDALGEYVNIIDDYDSYLRLGGLDFLLAVDDVICSGVVKGSSSSAVPYFEMNVFLTQNTSEIGIMSDIAQNEDDIEKWSYDKKGGIAYDVKYGSETLNKDLKSSTVSGKTFSVESKLETLRVPEFNQSDDGVLPGILVKYGGFYSFSLSGGKWVGSPSPGVPTNANYLVTSFVDTFINEYDGKNTIALVLYDNKMSIPYEEKRPFNLQSAGGDRYVCDFIESITKMTNMITFVYRIGSTVTLNADKKVLSFNGGIIYRETYMYYPGTKETFKFDGIDVELTYDKIDYSSLTDSVYSDELWLNRDAVIGEVNSFVRGDVWKNGITFGNSGTTINSPVFKEEYLLGQAFAFNTDIDIDIDRGAAAAFEKHFKLAECNTMSDLVDYGNNIFEL